MKRPLFSAIFIATLLGAGIASLPVNAQNYSGYGRGYGGGYGGRWWPGVAGIVTPPPAPALPGSSGDTVVRQLTPQQLAAFRQFTTNTMVVCQQAQRTYDYYAMGGSAITQQATIKLMASAMDSCKNMVPIYERVSRKGVVTQRDHLALAAIQQNAGIFGIGTPDLSKIPNNSQAGPLGSLLGQTPFAGWGVLTGTMRP